MKKMVLIALLTGLCACSSGPQYQWGNYPDGLYRYFQKPDEHEQIRAHLVEHIKALEDNGTVIPPGMYAEAGTYFLEKGDSLTALEYYKKEYSAWPESQAFMASLIGNLERHNDAR